MEYISHIKKPGTASQPWDIQSNASHSHGVADLAERFASEFGMGSWGRVLGLLHDKGKEKHDFQEYIQDVNGIEGHSRYDRNNKHHAIVGAQNVRSLYGKAYVCFETAAREFRLIDDDSIPVIVNWKDSHALIETLKADGSSYGLMKKLAKYSVNIRQGDFKKLGESGAVTEVFEGVYVVSGREQYDVNTGLMTENHWLEETIIL